MKQWAKKVFVTLVAVMTLGMYIPPVMITDAEEKKENITPSANKFDDAVAVSNEDLSANNTSVVLEVNEEIHDDYFINGLAERAKEQTMKKLGPKIANQVDDEITTFILPHIEEVIHSLFNNIDEDEVFYYGITERPSDGYGEKIFNIYDYRTNQEIALFHVRRDNRPLDGYWFNFHYHLHTDNFEKHYQIGDIYWDKNIPPKWMS